MGCTNSRVCPLPMGLAVETPRNRRQKRSRKSFVAKLRNVLNRRNKVAPCDDFHLDNDIEHPSTSYPRDESVNADEFLVWQRFIANNSRHCDDDESDLDDDDDKQHQPSISYPPGKVKKAFDILVIDHTEDEDTERNHFDITVVKTRPGGVAFEVTNDFDPTTEVADVDIKVSRGGVAFEIATDQSPATTAMSDISLEMPQPSRPITSMSCTRYAKEGVAFEIDFSDNEEEQRQLKTLSKVTSIMAYDGWSERDVIKEADDVWVANKVLAMKENAKKSQNYEAYLKKAELEFDHMTATMTDEKLEGFHYILVKESSKEHSLLRQAQFQAWKKMLRG